MSVPLARAPRPDCEIDRLARIDDLHALLEKRNRLHRHAKTDMPEKVSSALRVSDTATKHRASTTRAPRTAESRRKPALDIGIVFKRLRDNLSKRAHKRCGRRHDDATGKLRRGAYALMGASLLLFGLAALIAVFPDSPLTLVVLGVVGCMTI